MPSPIKPLTVLTLAGLLSACGGTPTPSLPSTSTVAPQSTDGEKVRMAEASGLRGVWISGLRGVWISGGYDHSTTGAAANTFSENLPAWRQVRLPQAHALTPNLGAGVTVAVIDTGIDLTHPAFTGKLAPASAWWDWVDGDALPAEAGRYDDATHVGYGHGTNIASIITQVAPHAKILPLRVLGHDGTGEIANVAAAIDYAVAAGAQVINLSIGTSSASAIDLAVTRAAKAGVYVTSAAGNSGDQRVTAPARFAVDSTTTGNASLSVGSVGTGDVKSTFSTYGNRLEVLAPGEAIRGAAPEGMTEAWNGTSMATPIVSGMLALALGELPASQRTKPTHRLALQLAGTADNIDAANDALLSGKLGKGRVNAEAFIKTVLALH